MQQREHQRKQATEGTSDETCNRGNIRRNMQQRKHQRKHAIEGTSEKTCNISKCIVSQKVPKRIRSTALFCEPQNVLHFSSDESHRLSITL
ncbi:hypothetical protein PoB_002598400 [Plakobranchus ocellatus]|uniref:Uncharacterized protein n=1 Tax=Plakobranchus ocellatus TaxID=259542 RepID=A0AAV3ZVZ1_9GAST|nr:hypothetical protein PoB_002598400 [Plakobranchus ocellatus]